MATEPHDIIGTQAPKPRRKRVALVLGAGGARGLAHIGVIEELLRRDYEIASISGSSMGALVGGIYATGKLDVYRDWACALERGAALRLLDFTWGAPGLIKGERVIGVLRDLVGDRQIEELAIPFTAVATDLQHQREVWLTRGPLFDAIRASIAIPTLFTPHVIGGRKLVDGGLLNPIPIAPTRKDLADLVIAVDVNARPRHPTGPKVETDVSAATGRQRGNGDGDVDPGYAERIKLWVDGVLKRGGDDKPPPQPGLIDLLSASLDTMQSQITRLKLALDEPDVLISVPRDSAYFYEFWRASELRELGRERAADALEDLA